MRPLFPLLLLPLVACGVPRDTFVVRLSKLNCQLMETCHPSELESWYGDVDTCRQDVEILVEDLTVWCPYDAVLGRQCLHELRRLDCEEALDGYGACAEVLYCGYVY